MGRRSATNGALQIDMRAFNKVVAFDPQRKEISVQSCITWRQLQEVIDSYGLSVQIKQPYANVTAGGSLSVN